MGFDFKNMTPAQASLIQSLVGFTGGVAGGIGQSGENQKQRDFTAQQNTQNQQFQGQQNSQQLLAQMMTNQYQGQMADNLNRDRTGMDATQLNPLAQQQGRANFALQGDKVNQWSPTKANFDSESGMGSFSGGYNDMKPSAFTKSFYTPDAMARAEMQDFQNPLQRVNPGSPVSNAYGAAGQGMADGVAKYGQGIADQRTAQQGAYASYAKQMSDHLAQQELEQKQAAEKAAADAQAKSHHSSIWGKIGGALKMAAPIAAAFIPGIGPLAAMALAGGGAAAGTAMQGGGVAQSLMAGGMGAAGAKMSGAGGGGKLPGTNVGRPVIPKVGR